MLLAVFMLPEAVAPFIEGFIDGSPPFIGAGTAGELSGGVMAGADPGKSSGTPAPAAGVGSTGLTTATVAVGCEVSG
jgi:hypothetical protein